MRRVSQAAEFLIDYSGSLERIGSAVEQTRVELATALRDAGVTVSSVYGRAKAVDSVRGKLLKKEYRDPAREMTDQAGVRVIVLRASEVDRAVSAISNRWQVIKKYSVDKRSVLGLREFGYRSVHLVCRIPDAIRRRAGLAGTQGRCCEIQVRSLLEHAWAEIEHGVVYKAGAQLPETLRRRFASLAAAIELIEGEFDRLGDETRALVDLERTRVFQAGFAGRALDLPRLIAILEVYRPTGESLRSPNTLGVTTGLMVRLVDALSLCGIKTSLQMAKSVVSKDLLRLTRRFAAHEVIGEPAVAHLAVCLLLIGASDTAVLDTFFPEFAGSLAIRYALS